MVAITLDPKTIPSFSQAPKIPVRFRIVREGEVTPQKKIVRVFRDWMQTNVLCMAFEAEDGEFSREVHLGLATTLAQGEWLVTGVDNTPPRKTRASYMLLQEAGTYLFNISTGEGAAAGEPAQLTGVVRVERVPANREIVVIERPVDGEWRVAGHGPTPGGSGEIDVRVVGGDVYAIGLDAWGAVFAPLLEVSVGQRIRPSSFAGWVYEITESGVLPSTEPAWWPAEGDNPSRPLGTARAIAVRYYQPQAVGPVPVEV